MRFVYHNFVGINKLVIKIIFIACLLAAVVGATIGYKVSLNIAKMRLKEHSVDILKSSLNSLGELMWRYDEKSIGLITDSLLSSHQFASISIFDSNEMKVRTFGEDKNAPSLKSEQLVSSCGNIALPKSTDHFNEVHSMDCGTYYLFYSAVASETGKDVVGMVMAEVSFHEIPILALNTAAQILIAVLGTAICIALAIFIFMKKSVIQPLNELSNSLKSFSQSFEFSGLNFPDAAAEIQDIAKQFKELKLNLDRVQSLANDQNEQLLMASKLSSLGEMAAGVAHEINNPLFVISGNLKLISRSFEKQNVNAEFMNKTIDACIRSTERIQKIVTGLKSFSRNVAAEPFTETKLSEIVADAFFFSESRMKQAGVQIINNVDKNVKVYCRGSQISQVLINLLNNAFDAISELSPEQRWIKISTEELGNKLRVKVIDGGDGIDAEIAEKIFLPFHTTKGPSKGTGLGLSISSKIMKDHGGLIRVNSNESNTCFELEFPLNTLEMTK